MKDKPQGYAHLTAKIDELKRELAAAIASFSEERERAQREGARVIKLQVELAAAIEQHDKAVAVLKTIRKCLVEGAVTLSEKTIAARIDIQIYNLMQEGGK